MDVPTEAVAGADVERNGLARELLGADLRVEDLGEAQRMSRMKRMRRVRRMRRISRVRRMRRVSQVSRMSRMRWAIPRGCRARCWRTDRSEGQILDQGLQQAQVFSKEALEDVVVLRVEQWAVFGSRLGRVGRLGRPGWPA
jgi:hypothetical protein